MFGGGVGGIPGQRGKRWFEGWGSCQEMASVSASTSATVGGVKAHSHWPRISIRDELNARIAMHFYDNSLTNANSCLVWIGPTINLTGIEWAIGKLLRLFRVKINELSLWTTWVTWWITWPHVLCAAFLFTCQSQPGKRKRINVKTLCYHSAHRWCLEKIRCNKPSVSVTCTR